MTRVLRATSRPTPPVDLDRQTSVRLDGLAPVEAGQEISVRGERGRFRFVEFVTNVETGAEWITAYGPVTGGGHHRQYRSFTPERVRTVHRTTKGRTR